jgi:hypothetical protein
MRMMQHIKYLLVCSFLFQMTWLVGQDSLLMRKEIAEVELLTGRQQLDRVPRSSIATGELMELGLTPHEVYIISSEEILRQNISTLTDVLRLVPGVVISPSGNATEGEKFLVNGLSGNSQMKVLVNGVPVKPWAASGMPIGSQLPIRQADRVEILLGSASSIYGEEACAGVINIVLEESERPVFTRTNLGFGRFGYNDLDLTFGGKLGRDKNIFKFTVYGRSTIQSSRDIFYNREQLFNFKNYLLYPNLRPIWERNENLGQPGMVPDSVVSIFGAPHESRQFGVMFLWRGIRFRYDLMSRRDYSSIGLNPMAVSYRKPGDRIGERIETFSAQFGRTKKRRQSNLLLSALIYTTTENSLKTHVFGAMGQTFYHNLQRDFPANYNEKLYNRLFEKYYNGQRSVVNEGLDARLTYRISFGFKNGLTWSSGFMNAFYYATQYSDLFDRAVFSNTFLPSTDTSLFVRPFKPVPTLMLMGTHYHQFLLQKKRLTLLAGIAGHVLLNEGGFLTKRFAGLYKFNKRYTAEANYGEGFTPISPFYRGSSVVLARNEEQTFPLDHNNTQSEIFTVQKSRSYQIGFRAKYRSISSKLSAFGLWQNRTLEGGYNEVGARGWGLDTSYVMYGYMTDANAFTQVRGMRFEVQIDSARFEFYVNSKEYAFRWTHLLNLQLNNGLRSGIVDAQGNQKELNYVPNYAPWNLKYGTALINRKFDLTLIFQLQGQTKTNLDLYRDRYPLLANRSNLATARRTVDLTARVFLNKNFSAWIDIRNALNRRYDGIDAYGTPDDLIVNPQAGRTLRFGLQYNLD